LQKFFKKIPARVFIDGVYRPVLFFSARKLFTKRRAKGIVSGEDFSRATGANAITDEQLTINHCLAPAGASQFSRGVGVEAVSCGNSLSLRGPR